MSDPRQYEFWADEDAALWDAVIGVVYDTYNDGVDGGVSLLPGNIAGLVDRDLVNQQAVDFARKYHYNRISKINDTTRKQVQAAIGDWIQSGESLPALEARLAPIYGAVRASMIATTEVTRVFAMGNAAAFEASGVVGSVTWNTAEDELVCPICGELDGDEIGIGDTDAMPPAHVNCRCWIQPIVDEAAFAQKLDEVLSV